MGRQAYVLGTHHRVVSGLAYADTRIKASGIGYSAMLGAYSCLFSTRPNMLVSLHSIVDTSK